MYYKLKRWFSPYLIKRRLRFFIQRRKQGWDDRDTWSLDESLVRLALPRLKRFKELNNGYPNGLTQEQWDRYLDRIISAMELYIDKCYDFNLTTKDLALLNRGKKLFIKHFRDLWW